MTATTECGRPRGKVFDDVRHGPGVSWHRPRATRRTFWDTVRWPQWPSRSPSTPLPCDPGGGSPRPHRRRADHPLRGTPTFLIRLPVSPVTRRFLSRAGSVFGACQKRGQDWPAPLGCSDAAVRASGRHPQVTFGWRLDGYGRTMSEVGDGGSPPRRADPVYVADRMGVLHLFAGQLEVEEEGVTDLVSGALSMRLEAGTRLEGRVVAPSTDASFSGRGMKIVGVPDGQSLRPERRLVLGGVTQIVHLDVAAELGVGFRILQRRRRSPGRRGRARCRVPYPAAPPPSHRARARQGCADDGSGRRGWWDFTRSLSPR
jgi:hypothetical protein